MLSGSCSRSDPTFSETDSSAGKSIDLSLTRLTSSNPSNYFVSQERGRLVLSRRALKWWFGNM